MSEALKLAMDLDACPLKDIIIHQDTCSGCEYYKGFELYEKSVRCVKCAYYCSTDKE